MREAYGRKPGVPHDIRFLLRCSLQHRLHRAPGNKQLLQLLQQVAHVIWWTRLNLRMKLSSAWLQVTGAKPRR